MQPQRRVKCTIKRPATLGGGASRPRALRGNAARVGLYPGFASPPEPMAPDGLRTAAPPTPDPIVDRTTPRPLYRPSPAVSPDSCARDLLDPRMPAYTVMSATLPVARERQAGSAAAVPCPVHSRWSRMRDTP